MAWLSPKFWKKVNKLKGDNACWLWTGAQTGRGYGAIRIDGITWSVHRLIYINQYNEIPDGLFVCHHCDIRNCVNPNHLFLGTNQDNLSDMCNKGRLRVGVGVMQANAKLTTKKVLEIRDKSTTGKLTDQQLAEEYNVSRSTICDITTKRTWRHV